MILGATDWTVALFVAVGKILSGIVDGVDVTTAAVVEGTSVAVVLAAGVAIGVTVESVETTVDADSEPLALVVGTTVGTDVSMLVAFAESVGTTLARAVVDAVAALSVDV